jgi:dTDP-4-dehydrorhamnose 3,5-epimerase
MQSVKTELPDVLVFRPRVFGDERGFFYESFRSNYFEEETGCRFVQDNHSLSRGGVLRGLHFQTRHPQGKLVRVVRGAVFDVAVDLRPDSGTYGKWVGRVISHENKRMMWIPPGFAHGFLTLSAEAEFLYKVTDYYYPEYEQTLQWNDPDLRILWPLEGRPELSAKDHQGKSLREVHCYV